MKNFLAALTLIISTVTFAKDYQFKMTKQENGKIMSKTMIITSEAEDWQVLEIDGYQCNLDATGNEDGDDWYNLYLEKKDSNEIMVSTIGKFIDEEYVTSLSFGGSFMNFVFYQCEISELK